MFGHLESSSSFLRSWHISLYNLAIFSEICVSLSILARFLLLVIDHSLVAGYENVGLDSFVAFPQCCYFLSIVSIVIIFISIVIVGIIIVSLIVVTSSIVAFIVVVVLILTISVVRSTFVHLGNVDVPGIGFGPFSLHIAQNIKVSKNFQKFLTGSDVIFVYLL